MSTLSLEKLGDEVAEAYNRWQSAQGVFLETAEALFEAKFKLTLAVDRAYAEGEVAGKNEREREANLRVMLPAEYEEVLRLERKSRIEERALRDAEIAAESVKLRVAIAVGGLALIR